MLLQSRPSGKVTIYFPFCCSEAFCLFFFNPLWFLIFLSFYLLMLLPTDLRGRLLKVPNFRNCMQGFIHVLTCAGVTFGKVYEIQNTECVWLNCFSSHYMSKKMPCQIRSMRLFSAVQCHSWLCRWDDSSSGMKYKGILSRGSGCQMPCFLSDLTHLAWPQPHVKYCGRWNVEGKREKSYDDILQRMCLLWFPALCFPTDRALPNPFSPVPSIPFSGLWCDSDTSSTKAGEPSVSISSGLSYPPPCSHLPHSPLDVPLCLVGMVRDKLLTDSSVWGAWNYLNRGSESTSTTLFGLKYFLWLHFIESWMHVFGHVPTNCTAKTEREPRKDALALLPCVRGTKLPRWTRTMWEPHPAALLWALAGAQG